MNSKEQVTEAVDLLCQLINIPSYSRQEEGTASLLFSFFEYKGFEPERIQNNIIVRANNAPKRAPVLLLNSHHDTVKPGTGWDSDPLKAQYKGGRITGLGSNDAGGPLVSMVQAFLHLAHQDELPYQLIIALTAEEEVSGKNGIELALQSLPKIDLGIVGEPTKMELAIAERGLMVLDVDVTGSTGHAARDIGDNAIYKAIDDLQWFKHYKFPEQSDLLGPIKATVTQVHSGIQHNVIPDLCSYVVDCRLNDQLSHEEVLERIQSNIIGLATPRSTRLQPSKIDVTHPIVLRAKKLGITCFGSQTMSDQALMPFNTVKIGPGDSHRSHQPNEYILDKEMQQGIDGYIQLLEKFNF